MSPDFLVLGIMWYVAFLFSIVCHEAAHAWAAKLGGDLTAFHEGQVSLDPLPHVKREPFGALLVPMISYFLGGWMIGWASAPYDPYWQIRYPYRAAWMSLAGPGANLLLVLIVSMIIYLGLWLGVFTFPHYLSFTSIVAPADDGLMKGFAAFLSILFSLNLLLAMFNLLPVPPLDGCTAITLMMKEETALRFIEFSKNPGFSIFGILIAWNVFDHIFPPVFSLALGLLYSAAPLFLG